MRVRLAVLGSFAFLGCSLAAAAAADDLPALRAKVPAAMQAAKSFAAAASSPSGFTVNTIYVAPDRFHSVLHFNGATYDVVLLGRSAFLSSNGKPYTSVPTPPAVLEVQQQLIAMPIDAVAADTVVDGVSYGQFETTQAGPGRDQHLTCAYDKQTYRLVRCAGTSLSVTFSRYDDPANVVTAPAAAGG